MDFRGKTILFLGSSVTYGAASGGISFVEFTAKECGFDYIKEAVSGTTLADIDDSSYVSRLKKLNKNLKIDLAVCQLSTNDSYKGIPLKRTREAIIFIIEYLNKTFVCPVAFFTGTRFESPGYAKAVAMLSDLKEDYDFGLLDLWNDKEMQSVSDADYARFMKDGVHPTLEGYRDWWTPKFVDFLTNFYRENGDCYEKRTKRQIYRIAQRYLFYGNTIGECRKHKRIGGFFRGVCKG